MQTWINSFTSKIRPSSNALEEADRQSEYMIEQLEGQVDQQEGLEIARVFIAGSNATHTTIRKSQSTEFDVDVSVYLEGENVQDINLRPFLRRKLIDIYPNKDPDDFETRKSAVMVRFRSGIKLNVDVVPIVLDLTRSRNEWWGYIPQPSGKRLVTSVPKHIEYVRTRTSQSHPPVKFNKMIRMMKWWSKHHGLKATSFAITILTGGSFDQHTFSSNWFEAIDQVFDYYQNCWVTVHDLGVPVRIRDPVNPDNNAAYNWTSNNHDKFTTEAGKARECFQQASDAFNYNDRDTALDQLQAIFGPEFTV